MQKLQSYFNLTNSNFAVTVWKDDDKFVVIDSQGERHEFDQAIDATMYADRKVNQQVPPQAAQLETNIIDAGQVQLKPCCGGETF